MSSTEERHEAGRVSHSLDLVAEALGRWADTVPEIVNSEVWDELDTVVAERELGSDDTTYWCKAREAVTRIDSSGGWPHSRFRDDIVGALSGVKDPVPLSGVEEGTESLPQVPEIEDLG